VYTEVVPREREKLPEEPESIYYGSKKQPPRRLEDPRQAVMKWRNV
jgi:hypothetical protein